VTGAPAEYRDADFRRFIAARFLLVTSMQVQSVAVGWQVYDLTRDPLALGLVGLCQFIPMFLLTLPAGDVADRIDQRRVYAAALATEAACSAALLTLSVAGVGRVWPFYAALTVFGAARAFAAPASQSLIAFLVPPERLPRALAWSSSTFAIAVIAGPALGGFLYALGPITTYAYCLAGFLTAATLMLTVRGRRREAVTTDAGLRARVVEGLAFVRSRPVVLGAISLDLFAVLLGGATALLPVYARDILHCGPIGLGVLRSAPAAGAALTAVSLARWPLRRHAGVAMFAAVAVFGVATIVFGLSTSFAVSLAALVTLGAADMVSVIVRSTLIQLAAPDAMRGRISAVNMLFVGASNELGEFESGVAAALLGPVGAVVAGGAGTLLVVAGWAYAFPALRRVDRLQDVAAV
jgi:MFS family permease